MSTRAWPSPLPQKQCANQIRLINTLNEEYSITMIRKMLYTIFQAWSEEELFVDIRATSHAFTRSYALTNEVKGRSY